MLKAWNRVEMAVESYDSVTKVTRAAAHSSRYAEIRRLAVRAFGAGCGKSLCYAMLPLGF